MINFKKNLKFISQIGLRTIYFNFKYLPFHQAIKFPILLSRKVCLLKTSGKIIIACPVKFGLIKIGFKGVGIFDYKYSRSIWQVSGTVIFNGSANIGHGSKISVCEGANLILGHNFIVTAESAIVANKKIIEFGSDCLLSWDVLVMDSDFHPVSNINGIINEPRDIKIGNHVWIGCRSLVLKGSIIPSNCIISANSLVNKNLSGENKIFGGQPAIELNSGVNWEL